jgi:hypothetical protein
MIDNCILSDAEKHRINQDLLNFSREGLRTLVMGQRKIPKV